MNIAKLKILVVDDEPSTRLLMSEIFGRMDLQVTTAQDGFTALAAIRGEMPDIILSDLNMPGMSGFELLSVVRRRFPALYVIAMSGAFSDNDSQQGVAADAFYPKASGLASLLQIVGLVTHSWLPHSQGQHLVRLDGLMPIWVPEADHHNGGKPFVTLACPDCMRTFPQALGPIIGLIQQTACLFCKTAIDYAIVPASDPAHPNVFQQNPGYPRPSSLPQPGPQIVRH